MKKPDAKLKAELTALATMSPVQLSKRWLEDNPLGELGLPPTITRRLLAQRLQERRLGGLPTSIIRELERDTRDNAPQTARRTIPVTPGARLIREWNGRTISVEVQEDGFLHESKKWRSLSEIARNVTGAHWSGPRFFGLKRRG